MKKIALHRLLILITIVAFISGCSAKFTLNNLSWEYSNVELSNHEGHVTLLDTEKTKELCITIMDVQFSKEEEYQGQFDYLYTMKFLNESEEVAEILILSQNSIVYDGYVYKCSETMLYLDGFQSCFS